jgi:hypothetical protein
MLKSSQESVPIYLKMEQESIIIQRKHDILLLLQHLAQREEVTVKIILDCLYDVGAINLIDNKFRSRSLKALLKAIAKMSKPAFRVIAFYWFKQNCPQLITNWLLDQVAFTPKIIEAQKVIKAPNNQLLAIAEQRGKIEQLRSQVRFLTIILITIIAIFSSSFAWVFYNFKLQSALVPESTVTSTSTRE